MQAQERVAHALDRLFGRDGGQHRIVVEDGQLGHGRHDTLSLIPNRRPQLTIVAPDASVEEAAAVVAALERFMRDTTPPPVPPPPARNPWQEAALREGVERAPTPPAPWL